MSRQVSHNVSARVSELSELIYRARANIRKIKNPKDLAKWQEIYDNAMAERSELKQKKPK